MIRILADNNVEGQVEILLRILSKAPWTEFGMSFRRPSLLSTKSALIAVQVMLNCGELANASGLC